MLLRCDAGGRQVVWTQVLLLELLLIWVWGRLLSLLAELLLRVLVVVLPQRLVLLLLLL